MYKYLLPVLLLRITSVNARDPGDQFLGARAVHEIRFTFSQPGFRDSLAVNYTLDLYMRATVMIDGRLFSHGSGETIVSETLPTRFTGLVVVQITTEYGTQSAGLFIH